MTKFPHALRLHSSNEDGFTLLEMLTVIAIVGVLAAVATPYFLDQRNVASDATMKSSLVSLTMHLTPEFNKNRTLPLEKEMFVSVSLDPNISWDIAKTTPSGYCVYVWVEGSSDHFSPATSVMSESEAGICAAEGITGTLGL